MTYNNVCCKLNLTQTGNFVNRRATPMMAKIAYDGTKYIWKPDKIKFRFILYPLEILFPGKLTTWKSRV